MSGVSICMDPAVGMQRRGLSAREIATELQRVPEACEQPLLCSHRDIGCREVNARYLRDLFKRGQVKHG